MNILSFKGIVQAMTYLLMPMTSEICILLFLHSRSKRGIIEESSLKIFHTMTSPKITKNLYKSIVELVHTKLHSFEAI